MGNWAVIVGCYLFAALFFRLVGGFAAAADAVSSWGRRSSLRSLRKRGLTARSYARSRISS
ncbi:MAG TPA: hypothetical protein VFW80_07865 [Gaiellaceae bacterium]|nr:hypothetical protein [Gaiellaceae bacterium]